MLQTFDFLILCCGIIFNDSIIIGFKCIISNQTCCPHSMSEELGFDAVIVRPGRLVGAPFTNFDLAKLLKLDQKENKGIILDRRDVLAGDCERADVATAISKILISNL